LNCPVSTSQELQALYERLLNMGTLVEHAVHESVQSLQALDTSRAYAVIRSDTQIDILEMEIEARSVHLLSLQRPSQMELRLITTVSKVITDLERIADNATNIAEVTVRFQGQRHIKLPADIGRMTDICNEMLHQSLQALIQRDQELARAVCKRDDEVDALYVSVFEELVAIMERGGDHRRTAQCANLMFVARFLERIADHSTNICERVVYLVTGKRLRLG